MGWQGVGGDGRFLFLGFHFCSKNTLSKQLFRDLLFPGPLAQCKYMHNTNLCGDHDYSWGCSKTCLHDSWVVMNMKLSVVVAHGTCSDAVLYATD